ncbi:MAG TPA: maleylpyruvate isomerase family mycothiol-dependent enzyme [Microlunatus sp.]|nr:maleylpyruvate isomerase family mycothiol-dependent enzyme [Microlunatus sp.]
MITTSTHPTGARPRRSTLDRSRALRLAATEYQRYLDLLLTLETPDWTQPTDCAAWNVRQMAAHNLGMAEMAGSLPEMGRQFSGAGRRPERGVDALTAYQVDQRSSLTPAEIIDRYRKASARAVRGRRRRSRLLGRFPLPEPQVVDRSPERWTFGYLFATILTRDTWMHRIDTARATGRPLILTADHDGTLVADVVTEWASRHGAPFTLHLTGPAGGTWTSGTAGQHIDLDAVQFVRTLSGRESGPGLLTVQVPF